MQDRAGSRAASELAPAASTDSSAGAAKPTALWRETLDELARRSYAELVARLVRQLGAQHLALCEDVVQEAFVRALRTWPSGRSPEAPERWLARTARHLALDTLRRGAHGLHIQERLAREDRAKADGAAEERVDDLEEGYAQDDTLRMMFLCAHPALPRDVRTPLVLKTVCGFGNAAIAAALLSKEATIAQRITRAKARLAEEALRFELPEPSALGPRLAAVLDVLYLLFNEGYRSHGGQALVRIDLVHEAVHLIGLLLQHPATQTPEVHAVAALFFMQGARLPARLDSNGELVTLAEQDRSLWDRRWIAAGMGHLAASLSGATVSAYHVEAAIASHHVSAPSYAATDWPKVLREYERLVALRPEPVVQLNRAVAVAKVHGVAAALRALDDIEGDLAMYGLALATRGQLLWANGERERAAAALAGALELPCTAPERRFLEARLAACRAGAPPPAW